MTKPLLKRLTRGFNVPSKSDKEAAKASGNPDTPQSNSNPGPTLQHVRNEKQSVQGIDVVGMQNTIIQTLMAAQKGEINKLRTQYKN